MAKHDDRMNLKRLAIVNEELCKPKDCNLECKRACPVNRIGKQCVTVEKTSKIAENLCIGCSACQKKCPFGAITIVNLPANLTKHCSHRYGENSFKLHRLPVPKVGYVLGLVGTNGIGKSTALKILSGKIKPNLGRYENEPEWTEILKNYRGSELQGYFTRLLENKLVTSNKIQHVDVVPRMLQKKFKKEDLRVEEVLKAYDCDGNSKYYVDAMSLGNILGRRINELSGGELQRFCIALTCMKTADVYIFDEPSSYLDVRQRVTAAREIRKKVGNDKYVLVVEHDLAILDLMSDYGCVMYGESGAYGVITAPQSIKNAINIFLDGYIPTENMRFRDIALKFRINDIERTEDESGGNSQFVYLAVSKTYEKFQLKVERGSFCNSEIIVFLGENGMGKSTFVNMLAGKIECDDGTKLIELNVSLKPQTIPRNYRGTVRELFMAKIRSAFMNQSFLADVIKPMKIDYVFDQQVSELSGGELQRISIILCLGKEADVYLLDEPSAFLDSDQRISIAKIIKRFVLNYKKTAFVVEHDIVLATYLATSVIVFSGVPGVQSTASPPMPIYEGMNIFLKNLDITFRRDLENFRPRINKPDSIKDKEQKNSGKFFAI